jgi:hypothetical protein
VVIALREGCCVCILADQGSLRPTSHALSYDAEFSSQLAAYLLERYSPVPAITSHSQRFHCAIP